MNVMGKIAQLEGIISNLKELLAAQDEAYEAQQKRLHKYMNACAKAGIDPESSTPVEELLNE